MRIDGIVVEDPRPGRFYLLLRSPQGGDESYHLRETPGRTNSSHRERFSGWLGETNNVSWHAEEAIEVTRGKDGRWKFRRFQAADLVSEDEAEEVAEV